MVMPALLSSRNTLNKLEILTFKQIKKLCGFKKRHQKVNKQIMNIRINIVFLEDYTLRKNVENLT